MTPPARTISAIVPLATAARSRPPATPRMRRHDPRCGPSTSWRGAPGQPVVRSELEGSDRVLVLDARMLSPHPSFGTP